MHQDGAESGRESWPRYHGLCNREISLSRLAERARSRVEKFRDISARIYFNLVGAKAEKISRNVFRRGVARRIRGIKRLN